MFSWVGIQFANPWQGWVCDVLHCRALQLTIDSPPYNIDSPLIHHQYCHRQEGGRKCNMFLLHCSVTYFLWCFCWIFCWVDLLLGNVPWLGLVFFPFFCCYIVCKWGVEIYTFSFLLVLRFSPWFVCLNLRLVCTHYSWWPAGSFSLEELPLRRWL